MLELDPKKLKRTVEKALKEDVGSGDITTNAMIPHDLECISSIVAKEDCVIAGIPVAKAVFLSFDPTLSIEELLKDGETAEPGREIMRIKGKARSILTCERTALNFMQRLSGVATKTRQFVEACGTHKVKILDTRKTTPLLRYMEKYAVSAGGGDNHRSGLYDQVLIKDNHLHLLGEVSRSPVFEGVSLAKKSGKGKIVEVEVENVDCIEDAIAAGADIILFDNMDTDTLAEAVSVVNGRVQTEASGGMTLENVKVYAETGVDRISIGGLTHSARAVDISLDIVE